MSLWGRNWRRYRHRLITGRVRGIIIRKSLTCCRRSWSSWGLLPSKSNYQKTNKNNPSSSPTSNSPPCSKAPNNSSPQANTSRSSRQKTSPIRLSLRRGLSGRNPKVERIRLWITNRLNYYRVSWTSRRNLGVPLQASISEGSVILLILRCGLRGP